MPHLILFTRPGCHLCEEVEALLLGLQSELDFDWERRDITADAATYERYKHAIPVVWLDGRERLRADVAPVRRDALQALLRDHRRRP